VNWSISVRYY